jgi:cytochrome P450
MPEHPDAFREARENDGVQNVHCDDEDITMILRMEDLRTACRDPGNFSSNHPFMVVLRSEEDVRTVRQLPIETDPPDHTDYRMIVQPLFRKAALPAHAEKIAPLVNRMVAEAIATGEVEAVSEFALPLQSRALTILLGVPESEADTYMGWGTHIFHDGDNEGAVVEAYTKAQFERAEREPGEDFFSVLNQAEFRGRKLTFEEKQGFANVAFAGGRDTVINVVASIIAYVADHPEALDFLRQDDSRFKSATEEFVRYVSPLTVIARTCPHGASVAGKDVPAKARVGLCWPSGNRDASVFEDPDVVKLDRKPNPHIGFGLGPHNCLGAPHARTVIKCVLMALCDQVERIELISQEPKIEIEDSFTRKVGYDSVHVRFVGKA